MNTNLLAALVAAGALIVPAAHAQTGKGDAPRKDTGVTQERPAAGKDSPGPVSDAMMTARVKAALIKEGDVRARDINVDTEKGVVYLRGTQRTREAAERAVEIAKGIDGVVSVRNELRIEPETAARKDRPAATGPGEPPARKGGAAGAPPAR